LSAGSHMFLCVASNLEWRSAVRQVVTKSEQGCFPIRNWAALCESSSLAAPGSKKNVARGGTRVPCEIAATLNSLDPGHPFSQPCQIILANLGGCAARSAQPVPTGTSVHLTGLPTSDEVLARVVTCISLGAYEHLWLLGLALEESGNVWGLEQVPEDWQLE